MRFKTLLIFFWGWGLAALCYAPLTALGQDGSYRYHAVFIYNFTRHIEWPAQSGPFVIGVLGRTPVQAELEKLSSNRQVKGRTIEVRHFKSAADVTACQILYVPPHESTHLAALRAKARQQNTLLITEKPGLALAGSSINFVQEDQRWKFELHEGHVNEAGLRVSSELKRLAILVGNVAATD